VVIGLYDEGTGPGAAISFPNSDPITQRTQWATIFQSGKNSYYDKTEAEVMKHAKTHAAEAHGLKEISADTEKKIKAAIKTVSTDVPAKK